MQRYQGRGGSRLDWVKSIAIGVVSASLVKKPRNDYQDQGEQSSQNDLHVESPHPLLVSLRPIDLSALRRRPVRRTIRSIGLHDALFIRLQNRPTTTKFHPRETNFLLS